PPVRLSVGHPSGQRQSVWDHGPSRAFAIECVVEGVGHPSGVHCTRPSRTEWRARADASSAQGRNHQAKLTASARPTTAHRSMGLLLRPYSPARGFGAAASRGSLSAQASAHEENGVEICAPFDGPSGPQQGPDQVATTKAYELGNLS